jgi:low affinity Fe/Cu permease
MRNPADRAGGPNAFDRFSERATNFVSRLPFLLICVVLVAVWAWGWTLEESFNLSHFFIDVIEIVVLLLVVFLQNSERREEHALHRKIDALANATAALMEDQLGRDDSRIRELREAIALEEDV